MGLKILIFCVILPAIISCGQAVKVHYNTAPYQYGYHTKNNHGTHFRKEESDGQGTVRGSYGYTDQDGTYREVYYVADHLGFRAEIKTNEQGTTNDNPANIRYHSSGAKNHPEPQLLHSPKFQNFYHFRLPDHEFSRGKFQRSTGPVVLKRSEQNLPLPLELARRKGDHGGHE